MVDPRLPSNPTSMLIQAQERKHLVNKLLNLKSHVDKKKPAKFSHLSSGRINQRNDEVRKINSENQQMLKKIMGIMNRKPKGNGLEGVPLKHQNQNDEFDEIGSGTMDTFQGNADISLIQSNVEAIMQQQNRFSFEINPHASRLGDNNPFKSEQDDVPERQYREQEAARENVETEGLKTPLSNQQIEVLKDEALTKEMTSSSPNVAREDSSIIEGDNNAANHNSATNSFLHQEQKKISPSYSQENYKNPIQSSSMFDNNLPVTDSEHENRIAFHPQNIEQSKDSQQQAPASTDNQFMCDPDALTFNQEHEINIRPTQKAAKKLFPAQVTLNHGIRKQEVQRINQQNMVMLKALKEIKPCVQHTQNLHKNFVQQEQYRRNLSKFRNVGKSQPKPRPRGDGVNSVGAASEALPDISNRQGAKISPLNAFPERKIGQRRTSQGYRGKLEPGDGNMAVPVSQRIHYRNQRMNFNSNNVVSEYHGTQSTRQGTDEVIDAEMAEEEKSRVQTFPQPVAVSPGNFFPDNQTGSIESSQLGSGISTNNRRPSYLQKLKKSPLLSSMTHGQGIPQSIVNRVISQRERTDTQTFRKYGIVPKIVTGAPSECFYLGQVGAGTSISQSSVISHTRRNRMMQDQISKLEEKLQMNDEIIAEGVIDLEVESVVKKKPAPKEKKKLSPVRPTKAQNDSQIEKPESKKGGATIFTPRQVTAPKANTKNASPAKSTTAPKAALPAAKTNIKVEEQKRKEPEKEKPVTESDKPYEIPDQSASDYTPAVSIDPTEIENSTFSHIQGTPDPNSGAETPNLNGCTTPSDPVVAAQEHQLEHVFAESKKQESRDFGVVQNMKLNNSSKIDVKVADNNQKLSAVSLQDVSGPNEEEASVHMESQPASRELGTEQVKIEQGPIKTDPSMPLTHKSSIPYTEGSKYSIPDDSNMKIQESKDEPVEEEDYQIISLQELEDEHSEKGGINKLQFVPSQGETKTDLKAQAALRQESQDIDYVSEEQTENSANNIPLLHQPTNEISEELPSMNSNPAAVTHMAASFPRQTTFDIAEDIRPSGTHSQNLRMISPASQDADMIEDQEDVKTIVQSKSMAQKAGGIRKHQSHIAGMIDNRTESSQGPKLEKTPTQGEVTRVGGIYAEGGPSRGPPSGTMTQGTGFVSGAGTGAIGQSKENIILSELSSKKNFE